MHRAALHPQVNRDPVAYTGIPCLVTIHPAQVDSLFAGFPRMLDRCMLVGQRPAQLGISGTDPARRPDYEGLHDCPVVLGGPEIFLQFDETALATLLKPPSLCARCDR